MLREEERDAASGSGLCLLDFCDVETSREQLPPAALSSLVPLNYQIPTSTELRTTSKKWGGVLRLASRILATASKPRSPPCPYKFNPHRPLPQIFQPLNPIPTLDSSNPYSIAYPSSQIHDAKSYPEPDTSAPMIFSNSTFDLPSATLSDTLGESKRVAGATTAGITQRSGFTVSSSWPNLTDMACNRTEGHAATSNTLTGLQQTTMHDGLGLRMSHDRSRLSPRLVSRSASPFRHYPFSSPSRFYIPEDPAWLSNP